jgi:hypothetical protein
MAGVFKSLDQADIRITPFRAHKLWTDGVNCSSSAFTLYEADYRPSRLKETVFYYSTSSRQVVSPDFLGAALDYLGYYLFAQKPPFVVGDAITTTQEELVTANLGYNNSSTTVQHVYYSNYFKNWAVITSQSAPGATHPQGPGAMFIPKNLVDPIEQGNSVVDAQEPTTCKGKYQRVVHRSIDHLYYRNFYTNNKASFGSGNINTQVRQLGKKAWVISMPQSKFGESILPGSIEIQAAYTASLSSQSITIIDDSFGNLYISGSAITHKIGQVVSGSISAKAVGEWPFDNGYKYYDEGPVSFTSSFNRGRWVAKETKYSNIEFRHNENLLGITPTFTSSLQSCISVVPGRYNKHYNFENGDFTISFMLLPKSAPTSTEGATLIAKEGTGDDIFVDENGNIATTSATVRSPYRILFTSESKIQFERDAISTKFILTSSVALSNDSASFIAVVKSGSTFSLYNDTTLVASASDSTLSKLYSNQSNIFIGNDFSGTKGFNGMITNIKFFNQAITGSTNNGDLYKLARTQNQGDLRVGNVFYNHGMMVLTSEEAGRMTFTTASARGTHTIWETEISCTAGPGEFCVSYNRSLQEYNPAVNQFVLKDFATGSSFRPYITTIGLYDDHYNLLAVGKLNAPMQMPNNMDTTFILRFDR